jgi:hypothetical protein
MHQVDLLNLHGDLLGTKYATRLRGENGEQVIIIDLPNDLVLRINLQPEQIEGNA